MRIKRNDIWLLVLLGLFALAIIDIDHTNGGAISGFFERMDPGFSSGSQNGGMSTAGGPKATRTGEIDFKSEGKTVLELDNPMGSVTATGVDSDQVKVKYVIKVYGRSKATAKRFIKQINIDKRYTQDSAQIVRSLGVVPDSVRGITVSYIIQVPKTMKFNGSDRYGQMIISDLPEGARLMNKYGEAKVSRTGDLVLDSSYSNVLVNDVNGALEFRGSYGKGTFNNVSGDSTIDIKYMPLELNGVKGDLKANTRYGGMNISGAVRDTEINGGYSNITFDLGDSDKGYKVEAHTEMADINSVGFSGTGASLSNDKHSFSAVVGAGANHVSISSDYGNVTIKR